MASLYGIKKINDPYKAFVVLYIVNSAKFYFHFIFAGVTHRGIKTEKSAKINLFFFLIPYYYYFII